MSVMQARELLTKFTQDLFARYPQTVCDLTLDADGEGSLKLTGRLLLRRDLDSLIKQFVHAGITVQAEVDILTSNPGAPFFEVTQDLLDLRWAPMGSSRLWSQVMPGEYVREFYRDGKWSFVGTEDQVMGWVENDALKSHQGAIEWLWHRPSFLKAQLLETSCDVSELHREARGYLKVPYLLGGRSRAGLDCSALTQLVFLSVTGRLLPRHSWDQKDFGLPILQDEIRPGDLIFALGRRSHRKHVAIYFGPDAVIHATARKDQVVNWTLELFELIYQVVLIRRLLTT